MERLTKRAYTFAGICIALGVAMLVAPRQVYAIKTESDLEKLAPDMVGDYTYIRGNDNPMQTYKMNDYTYETLKPFGIVARQYQSGGNVFDVVLIASNNDESFHDPRVCFTSQQYEIKRERLEKVPTKTLGEVPVTIAEMSNRGQESVTAFFYRGPSGFYAKTRDVKLDIFLTKLKGGKDVDGVFYRFIPMNPEITVDELKEFVSEYLEAANASSGGYF